MTSIFVGPERRVVPACVSHSSPSALCRRSKENILFVCFHEREE